MHSQGQSGRSRYSAGSRRHLHKIFSCRQRFDLLLLDIGLPDGSGLDLARQLRRDNHPSPIIFLTALVANEETEGAEVISGTHLFLAKPVDIGKLKQVLERHVRQASGSRNT